MNKDKKATYRLYGFVPYNLSPIQQGIQFGHALQEYNNMVMQGNVCDDFAAAFKQWAEHDKTFIILNGGTTNDKEVLHHATHYTYKAAHGSLNRIVDALDEMGIVFATFREPDLGDCLTAVVFLVDNRVFDYPKEVDAGADGFTEVAFTDYNLVFMQWSTAAELQQFLKNYKLA